MISANPKHPFSGITLALLVFFLIKSNLFFWVKGDNLGEIFLWYCNASLLILALGFWRNSPILVGAVFVTAIPAQSAWIFDFIMNLFGSNYALNRLSIFETYAESPSFLNGLSIFLSILAHGILIPLSSYGVWKLGLNFKSFFFFYWFYLPILLPISYWVGNPQNNINCMQVLCGDVDTMKIPLNIHPLKQMIECFILITLLLLVYLTIRHYFVFIKKANTPNVQKFLDPPRL